jgi:hypothetical protein
MCLPSGNCWIAGTLPPRLRQLRKLRHLNVANNWLNGTLPTWLGELSELQVLHLGSQFGDNAGTDELGLRGTIPAALGTLERLRELNLEANSLTGELPESLCAQGMGR